MCSAVFCQWKLMPEKLTPPYSAQATISLDGVYYASLLKDGKIWRLGSTVPDWREILDSGNLKGHGIWLRGPFDARNANSPCAGHLAVICCGLGSAWPGMGRELYENFPLAREAMEDVADLADWDILGLLAETSLEKISQTRWQIPYLFMLEYAQWRLFHALGLNPALISGHSLGELVALCLAGVYDLPTAWYLLDTRAEHMTELEAKGGRESGMLAVPASWEQIAPVAARWPDLRVANRNSYRQYILGGPIGHLRDARKQLRRAKVPAILLNIDLAFHNPAMRILRDVSLLRLNSLPMGAPRFPVLSCVDAKFYPDQQAGICRRIADLDENTVDWVAAVESMRRDHGITHCLELGPQETLCGLVGEISEDCVCLAADSKGHEAQTMRSSLAALFASGFLNISRLVAHAGKVPAKPAVNFPQSVAPGTLLEDISSQNVDIVVGLLAEASQRQPADIRPDMDLRHDLGLRSSTFPFLVMEAERRLQRQIPLETLVPLVTVADAIRFLAGAAPVPAAVAPPQGGEFAISPRCPLLRYVPDAGKLVPAPLDPAVSVSGGCAVVLACVETPGLLEGVADVADNVVTVECCGCQPARIAQLAEKLKAVASMRPDGMALELPEDCEYGARLLAICASFLAGLPKPGWLFVIKRVKSGHAVGWLNDVAAFLGGRVLPWRAVAWIGESDERVNAREAADMLSNEILHGSGQMLVWQRRQEAAHGPYCAASRIFNSVYPAEASFQKAGVFDGYCQFSRFAEPALAAHGGNALFSPLRQAEPPCLFADSPWLPLANILDAMGEAAAMVAGNSRLIGLTDLRLCQFPALPEGITRLCRMESSARGRMALYHTPARLCRTSMDVAAITPTGRQNQQWLPLARGTFIAAKEYPPLEPVWTVTEDAAAPKPQTRLDLFHDVMGLAPRWRFLRGFSGMNENAGVALLTLPAGETFWTFPLLLEGALQVAFFMNSQPADTIRHMAANMARWRFAAIALARFSQEADRRNDIGMEVTLHIRISWQDEHLRRYEGQVVSSAHRLLLAFHNLEFDNVPSSGGK